jgi:formate dehydrogenase gamma subunit
MALGSMTKEAILHQEGRVLRQPLVNRFIHWGVAISIFGLFVSGFGQMPIFKRYGVADLPGMAWMADYNITLTIHYLATTLLLFVAAFHVVYHGLRRDLGLWPRRGDIGESAKIIAAMLLGRKEPPCRKYLAEQRLAYAFIAANVVVLVLTGVFKVVDNTPAFSFPVQVTFVATMSHNASMLLLLFGILGHLAAFIIPANRELISGMLHGKVDLAYVVHRHELWHEELQARCRPAPQTEEPQPELASLPSASGQPAPAPTTAPALAEVR